MQASAPADRPHDEAPRLERYHSDDEQLVIYDPNEPLAWISADPRSVVEVDDDG
jgi:hypothetical protein